MRKVARKLQRCNGGTQPHPGDGDLFTPFDPAQNGSPRALTERKKVFFGGSYASVRPSFVGIPYGRGRLNLLRSPGFPHTVVLGTGMCPESPLGGPASRWLAHRRRAGAGFRCSRGAPAGYRPGNSRRGHLRSPARRATGRDWPAAGHGSYSRCRCGRA